MNRWMAIAALAIGVGCAEGDRTNECRTSCDKAGTAAIDACIAAVEVCRLGGLGGTSAYNECVDGALGSVTAFCVADDESDTPADDTSL